MFKTIYKFVKSKTKLRLMDHQSYRWFRKNFLVGKTAKINGFVMHLDEMDCLNLSIRGQHEPFETEVVLKNLKPGNTFVDVGAHIGYYTLLAARAVGPNGRVIAFEPDPVTFGLLSQNVEENGLRNVTLHQMAIADKPGHLQFHLNPANSGDNRVSGPGEEKTGKYLTVECACLDDIIHEDVSLLKMDIQGAEPPALRGAARLLAKNKGIVLITEVYPRAMLKMGHQPAVYLAAIRKHGFSIFQMLEEQREIKPCVDEEVLREWNGDLENDANLICRRE